MMPKLHRAGQEKSDATQNGLFYFLSFVDKEKQIDNDLLEIFVSAILYSLVRKPSQTFLSPVWKQRLYKTVLIVVIQHTC
tara:strand:- start:786 stop:1025 length:240 start_codon:yes stop_codon:yes gene_type:complete